MVNIFPDAVRRGPPERVASRVILPIALNRRCAPRLHPLASAVQRPISSYSVDVSTEKRQSVIPGSFSNNNDSITLKSGAGTSLVPADRPDQSRRSSGAGWAWEERKAMEG